MIDINILPQKAQNELVDFYQFLVERYVSARRRRKSPAKTASKQVSAFFDQYNIELTDFKFNRSELYDR